ncbi:MAG: TrkH family potassium uptake protein [Oscillospiraceae bacterium]|nr:TrkH family potassium uptake protein [Oscillospiraceae bacterium]
MSYFKIISRTIGPILLLEALMMLPALGICLYDGEPQVVFSFLASMGIICLLGGGMTLFSRKEQGNLMTHEGFVIVALCWIFMSLLGALPFWISGQIPSYLDALFETVSGFTTTGASILPEVETLSRGLLYWRSFTHWVGGMGMLVFALAVVPSNKKSGGTLYLMRAESPGPDVGKVTPRVHQTAVILYGIYVVLTIICFLFLLLGGMPLFDSVCTAFGTAGTGGFGIKNDSMVSYSPYLQNVVTVFMLIFGINFNLYYLLLLGRFRDAFCDEELWAYLSIFAGATLLIAWDISSMMGSFGEGLHHAAFTVSTIMSTSGYATTDFDLWPSFSKTILLVLMLLGGMAGSTAGGMKISRLVLMVKDLKSNIRQTLRPRSVQIVHLNGRPVSEKVLQGVSAYMAAYWIIMFISLLVVSLNELPMETNISAVFTCFNNVGPGFQMVGPMCNFGHLSNLSKIVLILDMLLGRLEIFPMLALVSGSHWQRRAMRK